ncbi:MAG: GAF domain-containing protein [Tetragenococcus sp.]|nr:GAF domain-containing protein [Tetragenococcus sp.]
MWNKEEKQKAYELLISQQKELIKDEHNWLATLSNASALLNMTLPDTVFAGFYLFDENELVLGPFQGNVSCTRIQMGKGVCGEAAAENKTVIVENVKEHKNYIACDSAALSEIVVPMIKEDRLIGVLDIDSQKVNSYDQTDQKYLEDYCEQLLQVF